MCICIEIISRVGNDSHMEMNATEHVLLNGHIRTIFPNTLCVTRILFNSDTYARPSKLQSSYATF